MKLKTINLVLKPLGIVLVVSVDDKGGPIKLWFERRKSYEHRWGCRARSA